MNEYNKHRDKYFFVYIKGPHTRHSGPKLCRTCTMVIGRLIFTLIYLKCILIYIGNTQTRKKYGLRLIFFGLRFDFAARNRPTNGPVATNVLFIMCSDQIFSINPTKKPGNKNIINPYVYLPIPETRLKNFKSAPFKRNTNRNRFYLANCLRLMCIQL